MTDLIVGGLRLFPELPRSGVGNINPPPHVATAATSPHGRLLDGAPAAAEAGGGWVTKTGAPLALCPPRLLRSILTWPLLLGI